MAYVNLIDIIYPVGSIYISVNKTAPSDSFWWFLDTNN